MWCVFFFRGGLKARFQTQEEAKAWINQQFNPTEYWCEYLETDHDLCPNP